MAKCVHHWLIDKPSGEFSRGKCRNCGEERDFANTLDAAPTAMLNPRLVSTSGMSRIITQEMFIRRVSTWETISYW